MLQRRADARWINRDMRASAGRRCRSAMAMRSPLHGVGVSADTAFVGPDVAASGDSGPFQVEISVMAVTVPALRCKRLGCPSRGLPQPAKLPAGLGSASSHGFTRAVLSPTAFGSVPGSPNERW